MLYDKSAESGGYIRRIGLRIFRPLRDIGVEGHVKYNSRIVGVESTADVAKIVRNVEKVACDTRGIDTDVIETNTNIVEASSNVSTTQIAGPEALSYLGEMCFGGPDAGSNTANSSADGRGSQCDIVEIDLHGPGIDSDMPRARSNVSRVHTDRRGAECDVNDFHKNIQ